MGRFASCFTTSIVLFKANFKSNNELIPYLKETRESYFCATPKNQALHGSASLFLK